MDVNSWLQLAAICFFGAISPGPSLAVVVSNTIVKGRAYGVVTGIGHGVGIGLWALLTAAGIVNVIVDRSGSLLLIQSLGACLIAYIGFRTLTSGNLALVNREDRRSNDRHPLFRGSSEGLLISLFNPKIALFFLAIFSHFVRPNSDWTEVAIMGVIPAVIDACWYVSVAMVLTVSNISRVLEDRSKIISVVSGGFLIVIGLYLLGAIIYRLF